MAGRLPSRVARVAAFAAPDDGRPAQLGIVGAGTSDASSIVDAIVDRFATREAPALRVTGRRLERDHALAAVQHLVGDMANADGDRAERDARDALLARLRARPAALVVEDAQWLDPVSLRVIVGVAERASEQEIPLTIAHRPAPGEPTLAALDALVGRSQPLVALGPLEEAEVGELAAIVLGTAVDDRLVDVLDDHTAGMPGLVRLVLASWLADGTVAGGRLAVEPKAPGPSLVAALRAEVDQLPPAARTVLAALSAGADLDDELLGATTDLVPDRLGEAVDALHAAGLVTPDGDAVPVVAAAVNEMAPVAERRRFHARLAAVLADRGAPATRTGEHLAAAGAQGPAVATAYVAAGDAMLGEAPELAASWYDRALAAGTPAATIAARRAEAAALGGDAVTALRLADAVVADPEAEDRRRALAVVAALLPGRGFWRRSSRRFAELAATPAGNRHDAAWPLLADIGAVATGGPLPGGADGEGDGAEGAAGLEIEALRLTS